MKILVIILLLLVLGYAGICALLYFNQDSLLFFPQHATAAELENYARQVGFAPWTNARGERIGWKSIDVDPSPAESPQNALLICHGNGGFALGRNYANMRHSAASGAAHFQIFLLEYPGYGARPGPTSARSLTAAAIDAIDTLDAEPPPASGPTRRIWLMGQSLGSGIASAAVSARPDKVAGLVQLTPFDSLSAAAGTHYPWLPVPLLLRHRLDSDKNLEKYHGPVAFIVAANDGTMPPKHGEHLFNEYAGPKRLWLIPDAGHNDFDQLLAPWPEVTVWLISAARIP